MKTKLKSLFVQKVVILAGIAILVSCTELPDSDSITMPTWDLEGVTIPLVNQSKTIQEILEDDPTFSWFPEDDEESPGVLYYAQQEPIEASSIGDRLKLDQVSVSISNNIGPLSISEIPTLESVISISDWTPFHPDESVIVPPLTVFGHRTALSVIDAFQLVEFNSAAIDIVVENNLPFEVSYDNLHIMNDDGTATVVSNYVPFFTVPPGGQRDISIEILPGVEILNSLLISVDMSSDGSDGQLVRFEADAGTNVTADIFNIEVSRVVAEIPQNSLTIDSTFSFTSGDEPIELSLAEISSGSFNLDLQSNIDVDANLTITFHDLYDNFGNKYVVNTTIPRSGNLQITESDLEGWKIEPSQQSNELRYSVTASTISTNNGDHRDISEFDDFNLNIELSELIFRRVDGNFDASFEMEELSFDVNYGESFDLLIYEEIQLEDAFAYLNLETSTYLPVNINGAVLTASNGTGTNSINLPQISLPSAEPIRINISDLFNGMTQQLPNQFTMNGSVAINPGNDRIEVTDADSIFGSVDIEIPLKIKISGGSYVETFEMDAGPDTKDLADNVQRMAVSFELINNIPAGVSLLAVVRDSVDNVILTIPTADNAIEKIEVMAPTMSAGGDVLQPSVNIETIELFGDDIVTFFEGKSITLSLEFNTAETQNETVKFRFTDSIQYRVWGEADLSLEN